MSLQGQGNRPGWRVVVNSPDHGWKRIGAAWVRDSGFSVVLRALPIGAHLFLKPIEGEEPPVPGIDFVVSINTASKIWTPIGSARSTSEAVEISLFAMPADGRFGVFTGKQDSASSESDSLDTPVAFDTANPY